jgi:hypothetical protein
MEDALLSYLLQAARRGWEPLVRHGQWEASGAARGMRRGQRRWKVPGVASLGGAGGDRPPARSMRGRQMQKNGLQGFRPPSSG